VPGWHTAALAASSYGNFSGVRKKGLGLVRLWILVLPPLGRDNGEHSSEAKVGLVPGHGHPS